MTTWVQVCRVTCLGRFMVIYSYRLRDWLSQTSINWNFLYYCWQQGNRKNKNKIYIREVSGFKRKHYKTQQNYVREVSGFKRKNYETEQNLHKGSIRFQEKKLRNRTKST